jgi:outer membrane protein
MKLSVAPVALASFALGAAAQIAAAGPIDAQATPRPVAAVVDDYVREALKSNLSVGEQSLIVERNFAALEAARAHFRPTLAFEARYSWSEGGRLLELPLGNLMNPVYASLNQLLAAQGKAAEFAPIQNENFNFLRAHEQDTRVTVRQPLYAPAGLSPAARLGR